MVENIRSSMLWKTFQENLFGEGPASVLNTNSATGVSLNYLYEHIFISTPASEIFHKFCDIIYPFGKSLVFWYSQGV